MKTARVSMKTLALGGCAFGALMAAAAPAAGAEFAVSAQALQPALQEFASQGDQQVLFSSAAVAGKSTAGFSGEAAPETALQQLLSGTDLVWSKTSDGALLVMTQAEARANRPQLAQAAEAGGGSEVEALIVTAQKREEDIQDVPIAISAFTQEQLDRSQVAGGPDLMTQVPNMTFTKTNFSSYSIQLRGIGTQAISATTDAAVAVAFNNTPFIRNRFFEQEFYDLQRVEVLRGPQGTLYGRNATAGVVNLISNKPKFDYEARLSGDVANYNSSRLEGMINVPLVEDVVALRLAGAWTKREGYATNQITGNPIDGRDLWSTRASLRLAPNDRLDVNLIWEHFEENDDRIRSGKQLCKTHEVTEITALYPDGTVRAFPTTHFQTLEQSGQNVLFAGVQATFSQGCEAASLYSPDSFQTPNGLSLPYYVALNAVGLPAALDDPYVSRFQSHDLRVIESTVDPEYRAKADVFELQASFDITDTLTLTSETAYSTDFIFSTQDYNRFNTASGAWETTGPTAQLLISRGVLSPEGVFCDPQIGCADRMVATDLSTATSRNFSQELRIGSSFDGPFNFSLGANFLRYDTEDKYYVFINSLSLFAAGEAGTIGQYIGGVTDNLACMPRGAAPPAADGSAVVNGCMYIDPNPISNLNDQGHNYFLSRNPYKLISYAIFGETYYQVTDALKVTAGLRWTVDKKEAPRIPSWTVAADTVGLTVAETVEQEWREPTGRLTVDWKPKLSFTDETLLYASYARGYKAGGMNPPAAGLVCYSNCVQYVEGWNNRSAAKPKSFDPEFVNAYELGAKNTMLDGKLTFNAAAFYYDYEGYQLSQIIDRSAISQNFDATVWGVEIEADWRPLENLRLGLKTGYENTRVADGERAIDVMDRTAGMPGWIVVSPFPTFPSNCVMPTWLYTAFLDNEWSLANLGFPGGGGPGGCELAYLQQLDPVTRRTYVPNPTLPLNDIPLMTRPGYPGWNPLDETQGHNKGEGFFKDLSGKELPNAPNWTATLTADYTVPLPSDWLMTLHTDLYYQSEAWTRIFNTEGYDKLKAYTNVNLAAIFTNEDAGWKVMAYVKNVFDRDSITGAFLNSDDTGLTTNVFLTDPRLYGLRVTKEWSGGPWWTGADPASKGPFPLTVELGGQAQRHDAPYEALGPASFENPNPSIDTLNEVQNRDLDWGDGRSVRLTYRPSGSPWSVAGGVRFGRTNNDTTRLHSEEAEVVEACAVTGYYAYYLCNPASSFYRPDLSVYTTVDYVDTAARSGEEHMIADFAVGRDVGLGSAFTTSQVSLGIRYGELKSTSTLSSDARGDFFVPEGWYYSNIQATDYHADIRAEREFKGTGPALTWDAAMHLLGSDQAGYLNLDWSVTGGVLFGDRETVISGDELIRVGLGAPYYGRTTPPNPRAGGWPLPTLGTPMAANYSQARTDDATVPLVDLSVGISYGVGRVNVGAGYRWERYFDVLDVGSEEPKNADRTIDGPYFKLSVGFGG